MVEAGKSEPNCSNAIVSPEHQSPVIHPKREDPRNLRVHQNAYSVCFFRYENVDLIQMLTGVSRSPWSKEEILLGVR